MHKTLNHLHKTVRFCLATAILKPEEAGFKITGCCSVHFSNISDWTVPPRGLKALYNLALALPPEQMRYMFGHIVDLYHEYGDIDFQLRIALFAPTCFVGFGSAQDGMDQWQLRAFQRYISLYKRFMRPVLQNCHVFHHTPASRLATVDPWCVLEYASPDRSQGYAGFFRLSNEGESTYHFRPRGIDQSRTYQVTWDNSQSSAEVSGVQPAQTGLFIRLEQALTSELLLFQSV